MNAEQQQQAIDLIAYLVEDSSCMYDHHGYCQEHRGGFRGFVKDGIDYNECWNLAAQRFLQKVSS